MRSQAARGEPFVTNAFRREGVGRDGQVYERLRDGVTVTNAFRREGVGRESIPPAELAWENVTNAFRREGVGREVVIAKQREAEQSHQCLSAGGGWAGQTRPGEVGPLVVTNAFRREGVGRGWCWQYLRGETVESPMPFGGRGLGGRGRR